MENNRSDIEEFANTPEGEHLQNPTEKKNDKGNDEEKKDEKVLKKKKRCGFCNKKLGMISFTCKCGKICCQIHLNPHSHGCTFDYVYEKKCKLENENPKLGCKVIKLE